MFRLTYSDATVFTMSVITAGSAPIMLISSTPVSGRGTAETIFARFAEGSAVPLNIGSFSSPILLTTRAARSRLLRISIWVL